MLIVDLRHVLYFSEMIAGAQRSQLRSSPFHRTSADFVRIGAGNRTSLLDVIEVSFGPVSIRYGPCSPFHQDTPQLLFRELEVFSVRSHTRRDIGKQPIDEGLELPFDILATQT